MIKIDSCFVHQEISVCHCYEKQKNIILTEKKCFSKLLIHSYQIRYSLLKKKTYRKRKYPDKKESLMKLTIENIDHFTLKAIRKYKTDTSIILIAYILLQNAFLIQSL